MKKLRNNRGETLIEVLASVLVAALSVALLFGCVMAASTIDGDAQKRDEAHYNALSAADAYTTAPDATPVPGNVTITREGVPNVTPAIAIEIYGGEGMYSYKRAGS